MMGHRSLGDGSFQVLLDPLPQWTIKWMTLLNRKKLQQTMEHTKQSKEMTSSICVQVKTFCETAHSIQYLLDQQIVALKTI